MKRIYLLLAVIITAFVFAEYMHAQTTDVTATYLSNPGFDINCNYLATDAAANLGSANGGANIKAVEGWTKGLIGDNSAAASYEFGYAGTLNVSGSYGYIPANGSNGVLETGSGYGALGISTAWSGTVTYYQQITLTPGKYKIECATFNSGPNATDNSRLGWIPNSGTSVLSTKTSFTMGTWETESVTFKIYSSTTGNIQVGINAPNVGSGSVGRIFYDYVKIIRFDVADKSDLLTLLNTANAMAADPQPVGTSTAYADLSAAITAAQSVYDDPSATYSAVIEQEGLLQAAIAKVNSAIVIYNRTSTWTTLPYDITSLIVNPSFETGNSNGWTNVGPFVPQTNTSFSYKAGTYYFEKWKSSGNWTGLKLSQKIVDLPNGIYRLTAGALNNPNTTGGAFVFANSERAEVFAPNDYTLLVTVTNNELEIGYEVINGGNYVATDNFRLSYISDGSPYVILAPDKLFFDPNNLVKTFNVSGGNLTENLTLTAPTGISLDKYVLTPAEVAAGTTVTATFDNTTQISNGTINGTSGTLSENITVNASADLACFTPLYSDRPNLIPNAFLNDISAFGGWGHKSVVLGDAYCGLGCVKFEATTNGWPDGAALDVTGVQWQPNSTYRLHAWVKAVDGTFAFFAQNTNSTVLISIPESGSNWVEIDELFTTGASPSPGFFTFNNVDGSSTGKIAYIDNYELYNVSDIIAGIKYNSENKQSVYVKDNAIVADINTLKAGNAEIEIYNIQGARLYVKNTLCSVGNNTISVEQQLPSGIYLVKLNIDGEVTTTKLVK